MERDSFVFYRSWWEAIRHLPREVQGDALTAIIEYGLYGEATAPLKPIAKAMLAMAKPQIDANNVRYMNGMLGGAPKGNQNARKTTAENNQKQPENNQKQPENNQKQPENNQKQPENNQKQPNVYVYEYVNDNDINLGRVNSSSSNQRSDAAAEEGNITEKRNDEILKLAYSVKDYYNAQVVEHKARLRQCHVFSNERRRHVMARLDEYGEEKVRHVIDKAIQSRFLNYEARNAPVDLEWLMRPTNFPKVYDGNYDNRVSPPPHNSSKVDNVHFTGEYDPSVYDNEEERWKQPLSSGNRR